MRKIRILFIITIFVMSSLLFANNLNSYYHANYGPIERMVFVFDEYPRYRLHEDFLSVNLSFLECTKNLDIISKRIVDNPVISKITFVPTGAFIGVLINTFEEYRVEAFILKSDPGYKLVLDIFKHKIPITPEEALEYADFFRNVAKPDRALYYENFADSLIFTRQNQAIQIIHKAEETDTDEQKVKDIYEYEASESSTEAVQAPKEVIKKKKPTEKKIASQPITQEKSSWNWLPERVREVLADIYHDKMLMFSIIVVFGVIFIMLIMSLIRRLHKHKKPKEELPSNSFGTLEFQRVTIKRLLSNGWQIEEIAKELNITAERVEELGRGLS